jgi:hypothetical protein
METTMAKGKKGKKDADDNLEAVMGIRVTRSDRSRLDALAERIPLVTAHAIARFALLHGLEAIERDPAILLKGATKGRKGPTRSREGQ